MRASGRRARRRGRRVAAGGALVGARRARGLETVGCREVHDAAVVSLGLATAVESQYV